jgi:hypothetical protein
LMRDTVFMPTMQIGIVVRDFPEILEIFHHLPGDTRETWACQGSGPLRVRARASPRHGSVGASEGTRWTASFVSRRVRHAAWYGAVAYDAGARSRWPRPVIR